MMGSSNPQCVAESRRVVRGGDRYGWTRPEVARVYAPGRYEPLSH